MRLVRQNQNPRPASLLKEWPKFLRRVRRAKRIALFLDFDGTLVGFRRDPKEVRLGDAERRLLECLSRHARISLVFISGRRRANLKKQVAVRRAEYLGLHGFESLAGKRLGAASRQSLDRIQAAVNPKIRGFAGIWLDDKQSSLALHYRGADVRLAAKARAAVMQAFSQEQAHLRLLRGKKILEILPPEIKGKGAAVLKVVERLGDGVLPVYFGDDATDEMAFIALRELGRNGGPDPVTVHVGTGNHTAARYYVGTLGEVKICLERLAKEMQRRRPASESAAIHARNH